jgi:hypothetical protein
MRTMDMATRESVLREHTGEYAQVALSNIAREFPADVHHLMQAPGDFPYRPRERTPVFYGSFDWHSCVEMFWLPTDQAADRRAPSIRRPTERARAEGRRDLCADRATAYHS